jgi:hypothetical protein
MQRITTSLKKTDLLFEEKWFQNHQKMQPKAASLQRILQFASSYKAEKIAENQFVELFLN